MVAEAGLLRVVPNPPNGVWGYLDWRTCTRFQPKRRASTDQAPGPSEANPAPMVPSKTLESGSINCQENTRHAESSAMSDPAMGVQRPMSKSSPAAIERTLPAFCGPIATPLCNSDHPRAMAEIPATSRISIRPAPGTPRANVENRRRRCTLPLKDSLIAIRKQSPKRGN